MSTVDQTLTERVKQLEEALQKASGRINDLEETVKSFEGVVVRRKDEKYYQNILEKTLGARRLHIKGLGITDLTTEDAHIEIKKWNRFHEVVGQLEKYNLRAPRKYKRVYFFGPSPTKTQLENVHNLMEANGIEMFSFDDQDVAWPHKFTDEDQLSLNVGEFVAERMRRSDDSNLLWTDLLVAYNAWPQRKMMKSKDLKEKFAKHGVKYQRTTVSNENFLGVRGWILLEPQ